MKANDFVQQFDRLWRDYLMIPCGTGITGNGFRAGQFDDDSAVVVVEHHTVLDEFGTPTKEVPPGGPYVLDWIDEPITREAFETMAHGASCVACMTQDRRAECVEERLDATVGNLGADPVEVFDGVRWARDGSYRGIDWRPPASPGG